ncbi:hypothetical protein MBLNU459_g5593t1 [Dothideomycetes sp. NU459]
MHYTHYIALAAASASLVAATPVAVQNKKAFTVNQVKGGMKKVLAPPIEMIKVYAKYSKVGAKAPSGVAKAAVAAQSGTVAATPESYDMSYLCPVTLGSNTLNLDFDTGSADLWVYSTLQPSSQQSGHDVYQPVSSQIKTGYNWSITYGDGSSASGKVYADKVVVGSVTATSQAVEAATSVSSSFISDVQNDGLLGLAFSTINTVTPVKQTTFFDSVKSSLAQPLFTVDLKKGAAGTYDFGFIDSSKYTGKITYTTVDTSNGFWQFTATGYAIGSGSTVSTSYVSIADTGTTLLYLPAAVVTAYYKQVTGATYSSNSGGYIFPCSSTLPNYVAVIGGSKFTVPGSYINYAPISNTMCFGGIQSNAGIGFSIFGDIFLKSQFVVFSQVGGVNQLGFAAQNSGTSASSTSSTSASSSTSSVAVSTVVLASTVSASSTSSVSSVASTTAASTTATGSASAGVTVSASVSVSVGASASTLATSTKTSSTSKATATPSKGQNGKGQNGKGQMCIYNWCWSWGH